MKLFCLSTIHAVELSNWISFITAISMTEMFYPLSSVKKVVIEDLG